MNAEVLTIIDDLIREYLVFRGFGTTLKSFETDCKRAYDFKYRVDSLVKEVVGAIETFDIDRLASLWEFFNSKLFKNLTEDENRLATELENDVYRLYLVNCIQHKQQAKTPVFFSRMANYVRNNPEWKEWYVLPFIPDAEIEEKFRKYFASQWQERLLVSLHNFVSVSLEKVSPPALVNYVLQAMESRKGDAVSHQRLISASSANDPLENELMDDFAIIAQ
ncbi:hypothetical protein AAVH_00256 [Aphelenchoides avenae]|nr:hypothetical protein AAVH_00256 [Aphelenchus avenae]